VSYVVEGKRFEDYVVGTYRSGSFARRSIDKEIAGWESVGTIRLHVSTRDPRDFYYGGARFWIAFVFLGLGAGFGGVGFLSRRWIRPTPSATVQAAASPES
jgi:hypothetical protein